MFGIDWQVLKSNFAAIHSNWWIFKPYRYHQNQHQDLSYVHFVI